MVRELRSPSGRTLVWVIDLLHVPPSCALALDWACSIWGLERILVLLVALPLTAAALPAPPMLDEVPCGPLDVAPNPSVDAEVPPAAALPPEPMVEPASLLVPAPTVVALGWAQATELKKTSAPAAMTDRKGTMGNSYLLRWTLQFPAEFATTVPPGPLVEPLTCPLPAVIEVDKPPAEARPVWLVATLQFEPRPLPVTTLLLEPPALLLTLTELCAIAVAAPRSNTAMNTSDTR